MPNFRAKLVASVSDNSYEMVRLAVSYLVLDLCSKIRHDPWKYWIFTG